MDDNIRTEVLQKVELITKNQAESFGCGYEIRLGIPGAVLINTSENTTWAAGVAKNIFGQEHVVGNHHPYMGSEDFAFMLRERPGNYCFLGNGEGPMVHHPEYIFNQEILPVGAAYWIALVEAYCR